MTVFTIAIPTFNRSRNLKIALDAISKLIVPKNVVLNVAISNSHSNDDTTLILDNIQLPNANIFLNNQSIVHLNNWSALGEIIPRNSDFVWLHGDDDIILNPFALTIMERLGLFESDFEIIITPAIRRVFTNQLHRDYLSNLACTYGAHEFLGWMSSLIISKNLFFPYIQFHNELFLGNPTNEEIHERRIGNLPHMNIFLRHFWNAKVALLDVSIIDEQVDYIDKPIEVKKRRLSEFKTNFHFTDRFFFDAENLIFISRHYNIGRNEIFFRYTTKSLIDVLQSIFVQELFLADDSIRLCLDKKLNVIVELSEAMGNHKNSLLMENVFKSRNNIQELENYFSEYRTFSYPLAVMFK